MPSGDSYNKYVSVTPSDSLDFVDGPCDALYVGGAGIAQVVRTDGIVVPFTAVAGEIIPIKAKRVNAGSTTATLMVALYAI